MRRLRSLRHEQGLALPMTIGIVMVLAIVSITLITVATNGQNATTRGTKDQRAFALAEAGMHDAVAALFGSTDPLSPTAVTSGSSTTDGGTASYTASLSGSTWTLTGTGTLPGAAGAGDVTRTTSVQITIQVTSGSPWYYLYSDASGSCMDIKKDAVVSTPLYVRGDLCLGKDVVITGSPLVVEGTLELANGASVGTPATPIAEARLIGGCTSGPPDTPHPCTAADRVYASNLTTAPLDLSKPPLDLVYWYANARPGPVNSCTVGSIPGNFDNDGNGPNRSRNSFNLTPGAAYDCRVTDASGATAGRLSWTPGRPGVLTVSGTIFFDGDVQVSDNAYAVYTGRATIYSSGTIHLGKNSRLCGVAACDGTWNWGTSLLMLIAGDPGPGETFTLEQNVTYQGQAYAVGDFSAKKDATLWGPVIANQFDFAKDGSLGTFPGTLPPGAPGANTILTRAAGSWRG